MTVNALYPNYTGVVRDLESNFHGGRLIYVSWKRHLMFTNPFAYLASPEISFREFIDTFLSPSFSMHPDWAKIDWSTAQWFRKGELFVPDYEASLQANCLTHKAALQLYTPGLEGLQGLGI